MPADAATIEPQGAVKTEKSRTEGTPGHAAFCGRTPCAGRLKIVDVINGGLGALDAALRDVSVELYLNREFGDRRPFSCT
jgi:hypothetical protein